MRVVQVTVPVQSDWIRAAALVNCIGVVALGYWLAVTGRPMLLVPLSGLLFSNIFIIVKASIPSQPLLTPDEIRRREIEEIMRDRIECLSER